MTETRCGTRSFSILRTSASWTRRVHLPRPQERELFNSGLANLFERTGGSHNPAFKGAAIVEDSEISGRFGFLTLDLVLRVILPGALALFLLNLLVPETLQTLTASPIGGLFAFLIIGFLSYSFYRAFYVGIMSRFWTPHLRLARTIIGEVTRSKAPWILVRALYIEWRETAGDDARFKYIRRLAPYVHAGYQAAIIFLIFGLVANQKSRYPGSDVLLLSLGVLLFLASLYQDDELNTIERDLLNVSRASFRTYVVQVSGPAPERTEA